MRNSSKKLLIISFLVVICLFAFYKVIKYYRNQDIKPIIGENINVADEEIQLGDIAHCFAEEEDITDVCTCSKWSSSPGNNVCDSITGNLWRCVGHGVLSLNCYAAYECKTTTTVKCTQCDPGYKVANNGKECVINSVTCAIGTYWSGSQKKCVTCLANHYCPGVSITGEPSTDSGINPCASGKQSPAGSGSETMCQYPACSSLKTKKDCEARSDCLYANGCYSKTATKTCVAGTYWSGGNKECRDCPAGSWCPGVTVSVSNSNIAGITSCGLDRTSPPKAKSKSECTLKCPSGYSHDSDATEVDECYIMLSAGNGAKWNGSKHSTYTCANGYYYPSARRAYYELDYECVKCDSNLTSNTSHTGCISTYTPCAKINSVVDCTARSDCAWDYTNYCHDKSTTITCAAGTYYVGQGKCADCLANYWCPGVVASLKDSSRSGINACPTGKVSASKSTKESDCKKPDELCDSGYVMQDGKCVKDSCVISVALISNKVSPDDELLASIDYNGSNCKGKVVTYSAKTNCTGAGEIVLSNMNAGTEIFSLKVGKEGCRQGSFTVSGPGISNTIKFPISSKWHQLNGVYVFKENLPSTVEIADNRKVDYYGICQIRDDGKYECKNVSTRSCGDTLIEAKACYADASVLSLASSAKWISASQIDSVHRVKVSNVTKEADCKVTTIPNYCKPEKKVCSESEKTAGSCEGDISISYSDGMSCSGNAIYDIICNNKTTVKFDYNDNDIVDKTKILYVGQGFRYGIVVTTERTCTATFNQGNWKNVYNAINTKITRANADLKSASGTNKQSIESEIKRLQGKLDEIKGIVTEYNKYNLTTSYNETGSMLVKYKVNKAEKTANANFEQIVINDGTGTYSNKTVVNLGVSGVTNPYNYTWTNKTNPRKIKLVLPKTYISESTGAVATSGLDGGNKIYIDYNATPGTYSMEIDVSGIGCNDKITNNKCSGKIEDQKLIYRPIDVSNPFINSSWTPGANWINSNFDFRNIIKENIWSTSGCFSQYIDGKWSKCN